MCMEDVRIGRKSDGREETFALTTNYVRVLGANPKRTMILFGQPNSGTAFYTTQPSAPALAGIQVQSDTQALRLTVQEHGNIVTKPWFCAASAGTPTITVLEAMLQDE